MKSAPKSKPYSLRPQRKRKPLNHFLGFDIEDADYNQQNISDAEDDMILTKSKRRSKKKAKKTGQIQDQNAQFQNPEQIFDENLWLDKLPKKVDDLERLLNKVNSKIDTYKKIFLEEERVNKINTSFVECNAIPICADVRNFDFQRLRSKQLQFGQRLFDVIMIDPPWKLSSSNPSRGVAIQYSSLSDDIISNIPIPRLMNDGFLFIWTINAKYSLSCKLMQIWGYQLIDEVTWVKKTVNGKIAKGHGFYLQHAKQSCLVGVKGTISNRFNTNIGSDVIFSQRRGQSQKPTQIYEMIQKMCPQGFYLQIFGRRNNLRDRWVTVDYQKNKCTFERIICYSTFYP